MLWLRNGVSRLGEATNLHLHCPMRHRGPEAEPLQPGDAIPSEDADGIA
jgi:hypothetical protein